MKKYFLLAQKTNWFRNIKKRNAKQKRIIGVLESETQNVKRNLFNY